MANKQGAYWIELLGRVYFARKPQLLGLQPVTWNCWRLQQKSCLMHFYAIALFRVVLRERMIDCVQGIDVRSWWLSLDWTGADEDQGDVNVWEDNWDDDNVEDDFSQQLRSAVWLKPTRLSPQPDYYFVPELEAAKYCDECVCLSVRSHNLKTARPNITKFLHIVCGRGSFGL